MSLEEIHNLRDRMMQCCTEVVKDYLEKRDRIAQLEQECEQLKKERDQYKAECEAYALDQWEAERARAGQ